MGGTAAFLYSKPEQEIKRKKHLYGRRLKYEQSQLSTRQRADRGVMADIEETVKKGKQVLNDFEKDALKKIQVLRSDLELMYNNK